MKFTKDSRTVKSMLIMMNANDKTIDDIDSFIPNQSNLRDVVRECLEESETSSKD